MIRRFLKAGCGAGLLACFLLPSGCQKKEERQSAAVPIAKVSSVQVKESNGALQIQSAAAEFDFSSSGYLQAKLKRGNEPIGLDKPEKQAGQLITADGTRIDDFVFDLGHAAIREANGKIGKLGKHIEVEGKSASSKLSETVIIEVYDDFPGVAIESASFRNADTRRIALTSVDIQRHNLNAALGDSMAKPNELWSFFGSSLKWGNDEVVRIPAKFSQENPFNVPIAVDGDLGGAGGGIPVVAFWGRNVGTAIGHIETLPLTLSIPVRTLENGVITTSVHIDAAAQLKPGEVYSTPRTFVSIYKGDYFQPLQQWSDILEREGLTQPSPNKEDYAVTWCSWGYKANVTATEMLETIPTLRNLGIHWATMDDRWYNNYGDWMPRADTFPGNSVQEMVKQFHSQGIKVQIWWLPLAVEDGHYSDGPRKFTTSEVVKEHPDWLVLDKNGKPARMTRNLATLCPAVPEVQEYYKHLTERFIRDWDFDGHKLDNIFAMPQCFNPKHHHKSSNDSTIAMGNVYKAIFETTRALKPDSVTQSCPCGTPPSLAWFRYMDQGVTADPISSVQVRRRIKMYKAILGPRAAVYGDHVELTRIVHPNTPGAQQLGVDFASTLGTGGVLGTKFTLPQYSVKFPYTFLSPEKSEHWKEWIGIYNEKMLSQGDFQGLYTFGYDVPEAYAIAKDGNMYYAFYDSDESPTLKSKKSAEHVWKGEIELRGLPNGSSKVVDYIHKKELGTVQGPTAKLKVEFEDSLLLEAIPVSNTRAKLAD